GGLLAVVGDAAPDSGRGEEALGEADVVLRKLRAVDDAGFSDRAGEVQGRVAVAGAELEDATGTDGPRQHLEVTADERAHDGELPLPAHLFHLEADGIPVVVQLAEVLFDPGVDY